MNTSQDIPLIGLEIASVVTEWKVANYVGGMELHVLDLSNGLWVGKPKGSEMERWVSMSEIE